MGLAGLSSESPEKKFRLPIASADFELSDEWKAELDRREEALDKGASEAPSTSAPQTATDRVGIYKYLRTPT